MNVTRISAIGLFIIAASLAGCANQQQQRTRYQVFENPGRSLTSGPHLPEKSRTKSTTHAASWDNSWTNG
ncbi:MAG: hypothetical protein J0H60_14895 [Rhizobiales bacterium]|nr:hypothetical protein [Hyphomicrobiales bacterium]